MVRLGDALGGVEFLKRRYASAIERGDDRTATRLRAEIDWLINGRAALHGGVAAGTAPGGAVIEASAWWSTPERPVAASHDLDDILGPHA